jgi:pyruvate formate lyase activating enzyme
MMDRGATPVETLMEARKIGMAAGLMYVYTGNIPGQGGEDTRCPGCGATVISRRGFQIMDNRVKEGRCSDCGAVIHGVGM